MVIKQITTEQIEKVKELREDFKIDNAKIFVVYCGTMFPSDYCQFLGIDYETVRLFGAVSYAMTYYEEGTKYQLACETFIDDTKNDKLSFTLEDSEDYLGFFTKEEEQKIGVAQWLPSNWKELITDEQLHDILQERNIQTIECLQDDDVPDEMKERIARDWCKENSDELIDFLSDSDKADIAYDYIDDNANDVIDRAYDKLGDYERREFIKDCIDNL
jgi:hypothetical protein